jgi:hypothetical protein
MADTQPSAHERERDAHLRACRERDAVERACQDTNLDAQYAMSVHAYLSQDEDEWPACCGSSCEPCVLALEHTARRALIILESAPPALESAPPALAPAPPAK